MLADVDPELLGNRARPLTADKQRNRRLLPGAKDLGIGQDAVRHIRLVDGRGGQVEILNPRRPPERPARACDGKAFRVVPNWFIGRVSGRSQTAKMFHAVPNWFTGGVRGRG